MGAELATLKELETHWSMDDMVRANAMLDMKGDIEETITSSMGGDK